MPSVRGPSAAPCQSDPPLGTSQKCSTSARNARDVLGEWLGCRTSTPSMPCATNASMRSRVPPCAGCASTARPPARESARSRRASASRSFGDVRRTAVAEIAVEGVAEVDRPAFGDHRARDVRPADRAAGRLLEHRRRTRSARRARSAARRCARRAARRISRSSTSSRSSSRVSRRCRPRMCVSTSPSTALSSTPGTTRTPSSAPVALRLGDAVDACRDR